MKNSFVMSSRGEYRSQHPRLQPDFAARLLFNGRITLKNIPPETHEYVVNGKSALEWVMERYEPYADKDSGIKNDSNEWCREHDDPTYILNLVKRVIRVSVETVKIVGGLPSIQ